MKSKTVTVIILLGVMLGYGGIPSHPAMAVPATTSIHIVRYATDQTTILDEKTIDYTYMESSLPVQGDGTTHFYHQGPTFNENDLWDPGETVNLKDKGALKGTALKDLCNLVGGMAAGETVNVKASDNFNKTFDYETVYTPHPAQGNMVICWYHGNFGYVPAWEDGMQLAFFAGTTNGAGQYVFGNQDMYETVPEARWHYYYSGGILYPSTNGFTVRNVSEVIIYSNQTASTYTPPAPTPAFTVSNLDITPSTVYTGEEVTVRALVTNAGTAAGTYEAVLMVNGESEASNTLTLAAGESEEVTFTVTRRETGNYVVTLGTSSKTFTVEKKPLIDAAGTFTQKVTVQTNNAGALITVDAGTTAVTGNRTPVTSISIRRATGLPRPSQDYSLIGYAYDFSPDGTQFDTPVTVLLSYEPDDIPGQADEEDLVIGYLETGSSEWVFLDDCVIDTDNTTISVQITHFTVFAVFADTAPQQALISISDLTISPESVIGGETVTVGAMVTNTGDVPGSYEVVLRLGEKRESSQTVTLEAGESRRIDFPVTKTETGTYDVRIDQFSGVFEVTEKPPAPDDEISAENEGTVPVSAGATTSVSIIKYAADGTTELERKRVDYVWMKENLPVYGDGETHYYHQGPVFEGDMWNPGETENLKDKGALMGTSIKDICGLTGGMSPGNEVMICAVDGYNIRLGYEHIYEPLESQGTVVLCWYKAEDEENSSYGHGYPGNDAFSEALQVIFMAGTKNGEGNYVFGNTDMKQALSQEEYRHFYDGFPSTNGLSGKWISEIRIFTGETAEYEPPSIVAEEQEPAIPWLPVLLGGTGLVLVGISVYMLRRNKNSGV